MKTIVTGGAGFIGSHMVDRLVSEGHEVVVIDNHSTGRPENISHVANQITVIDADLSEYGEWADTFIGADWVIHLAALADIVPSIEDPSAYFRSNVAGTFNVLQAARQAEIERFIYAASSSCYGIPEVFPTPEAAPLWPQYPYALTKMLGENLAMHWAFVYSLPVLSLRFFNVYGPRSRTSGTYGAMFGVFLAQKLAGKPFTVVGDGTQTRDFTYVSDIVEAIWVSASSELCGEIFNVGSNATISVNRIVELLDGPVVNIPARPGEPDCTYADITHITSRLGWSPCISIEEGVAALLRDIDYWSDAPVWDPDSIAAATRTWFEYLGKGL